MPKEWETPGRALTDEERETVERICEIVVEHPKWKTAALAALLAMKSRMTRAEMLSLKLKDCCLEPPSVGIQRRGAKRLRRERKVHLHEKGAWALEQLIKRAVEECGASDAEHFLFPFHNDNHTYDPTKPGKGYRAGMKKVFELAGSKNFKPNYFRHDAISRGLANPNVSVQAAISHFGWIGPKMIQRYYHAAQKEGQIVAAAIEAREDVHNADSFSYWFSYKTLSSRIEK
jgi:integrase